VFGLSAERLEEIRALVRAGRYVQAARETEELLEQGLDPEDQVQAYHIQTVAYYRAEQIWPAYRAAQRTEFLATQRGMAEIVGRARINLVAIITDIGDYRLACEVGKKLLATENELSPQTRRELPAVRYNLARASRCAREYSEAYDHLERAITDAENLGFPSDFRVQMHQLMAWWLLLDERIGAADRHIERAEALIRPEDRDQRREQLLVACLRAYTAGQGDRAVEIAEEFISKGAPATTRQRAWAYLITGWVMLDEKRWDLAEAAGDRALESALDLGSPELMQRANDLRIRAVQGRQAAG
jgi:tetratricopeptide (TPR) repeat protein